MLLTAQRVRTPSGAVGVNVALYGHEEWARVPAREASESLELARRHDGRRLVALSLAFPPGGNRIESELEIAGPDGTPKDVVGEALREVAASVGDARERVGRFGEVVIAFRANVAAVPSRTLVGELAAAALQVLSSPARPTWLAHEPLQVWVDRDDEAWKFTLAKENEAEVRGAGGAPANIRVRHDVARQFRQLHGPLYPHVAQWVTNLKAEEILKLGGVRFVDARRTGQILGEWPARR